MAAIKVMALKDFISPVNGNISLGDVFFINGAARCAALQQAGFVKPIGLTENDENEVSAGEALADQDAGGEADENDLSGLGNKELKALLDAMGVEYKANLNKQALIALVLAARENQAAAESELD